MVEGSEQTLYFFEVLISYIMFLYFLEHLLGLALLFFVHGFLPKPVAQVVKLQDIAGLLFLECHLVAKGHLLDDVVGHQTVPDLSHLLFTFTLKPYSINESTSLLINFLGATMQIPSRTKQLVLYVMYRLRM